MNMDFPYDYFALRGMDISVWHDSFHWAVPRQDTTAIVLDLKAEHCRKIAELGETFESDCLLVGHHLSSIYAKVLNHWLSVHRLENDGFRVKCSEKLSIVPQLLKDHKEAPHFQHEDIWKWCQGFGRCSGPRYFLRSLKYNFSRGCVSAWNHRSLSNSVYAFPSENVTERPWTLGQKDWVHLTSPGEWIGPKPATSVEKSGNHQIFEKLADEFRDFADSYMKHKFGVSVPEQVLGALREHVSSYLKHIAVFYETLSRNIKGHAPKRLFTMTAGKSFVRAMSLAVRQNGGTITGFPHNYFISHYASPRTAFHELAAVDEFVAYTPGSVPLMERNIAANPPPRKQPVNFVCENNPTFKRRWEKEKNKPLPSKIRTVMVLELSLGMEMAPYYVPDSLVTYHFYYSLCKSLGKLGYRVLFKRRPKDLSWEGINIFSDMPHVRVVDGAFESSQAFEEADAVFVQYAMSSTLFWSMTSNKPVIYVDAGWEPWYPEVYESMAKRCRVLHCWYDERNRQCFDESELQRVLEKTPGRPDTEFMEKYLFSK
ncbi:MAG: hypothetical protein A2X49_03520 [Lentisphaerae bacterium GWF2_52_8]|nr:MAG: hypothetical protein A2X49_03520 [Lentisphaerae bacterium GWF2_52_8]